MPESPMTLPRLLLCTSLLLTGTLAAEDIAVVAKNDCRILGAGSQAAPEDPSAAAFVAAATRFFAGTAPYDAEYPLINPPAWGRVVSAETAGTLHVRRSFARGFVFHLDLEHLLPRHTYVLCINGRPQHPGNELLPESVPGHAEEKYYDFCTVTTDDKGGYHAGYALLLRPGPYNVHFYVKDTSDFKIVLYGLEYFDFAAR
jgi:hypothetical protein